jgi:hypothetical protein
MVDLAFNYIFEIQNGDSEGADEMAWDYRVVFSPYEDNGETGEFSIREVYYDEEGEIAWWSDEAIVPSGDDFWSFAEDFDAMAHAFERPVLVLIGDELIEDDEEEETEE